MFLIHPFVGPRAKKCRSNRHGAAAGLFGPARHRFHHSPISPGAHLKAAPGELSTQPARLFVIGFAGAWPRTAEHSDDGAFRGHAGNYFTGRSVSCFEGAERRLTLECGVRVSGCGANSSTMATQIESTTLIASRPCVPVLLPKIEKIRWAPRRDVA